MRKGIKRIKDNERKGLLDMENLILKYNFFYLDTTQPPLLYHLKVDLWSKMSMLHVTMNGFGVYGWDLEI